MTRDEIRLDLRKRRKDFVIAEGNDFPFDDRFLQLMPERNCIGGYVATRWEASLSQWWGPLLSAGNSITLPYLRDRDASMEFRQWDGSIPLETAPFGLQQPSFDALPSVPDLVLVPLTGFDRQGNRLGQGAGHYDRYFERYPDNLKIGIAWSCQEYPQIPVESWDVPLDIIITEREWIDCRNEERS